MPPTLAPQATAMRMLDAALDCQRCSLVLKPAYIRDATATGANMAATVVLPTTKEVTPQRRNQPAVWARTLPLTRMRKFRARRRAKPQRTQAQVMAVAPKMRTASRCTYASSTLPSGM